MTTVLVLLVYSTSASGFYARASALSSEYKRISLGLSEACTNAALLKIAQNYNYLPPFGGEIVTVGPDTCIIKSVSYNEHDEFHKTATIHTASRYPNFGGSWSTTKISATVQNPAKSVAQPAPVCVLQITPTTVQAGRPITVQWSSSSNATEFTLTPTPNPIISNPADALNGTRVYTINSPGPVEFSGQARSGAGILSQPCTQTVLITEPPPTLACADTVMMLDRTPTMDETDLTNERNAAKGLIDLYDLVDTNPKIGVGSFVAYGSTAYAAVPTAGWLQSNYDGLRSLIDSITAGTQGTCSGLSGCTDISAAITSGYQELGSVRHSAANQKVLILVSDGQANRPTGDPANSALTAADSAKNNGVSVFTVLYNSSGSTSQADRNLMARLASGIVPVSGHFPGSDDNSIVATNSGSLYATTIHTPNTWTNPSNAFGTDGTYATDSVTNHQQGYANFHFNVPGGSTISGIEAYVTGLSGAATINSNNIAPSGIGASSGWNLSGAADKAAAVATSNNDSSYISLAAPSIAAQTFIFPGAAIPLGSTINSVTVGAVARSTTGAPSIFIRAEDASTPANVNDGSSILLTASYATSTRVMTQNPLTGSAWTLAEINGAAVRYGVVKGGTGNARVTNLYMVVNYSPPASGSCQIATNVSWNNGSSWNATAKSITLTSSENAYAVGGATDTWGRSWTSGELSDSNFVLRLTNTNCSGALAASVNSVQVRVYYTGSNPETENSDGDNFFITPSTSLASIQNIFDTIGRKVCPAAAPACSNGADDDGDGQTDANDLSCRVGGTMLGAYNPNDNDEWTAPAIPAQPTAPLIPSTISIGSWDEIISPNP